MDITIISDNKMDAISQESIAVLLQHGNGDWRCKLSPVTDLKECSPRDDWAAMLENTTDR